MSASEGALVTLERNTAKYTIEILGGIGSVTRYLRPTAPSEEARTSGPYETYSGPNPLEGDVYQLTLGDPEGGEGVYIRLTQDSRVVELARADNLEDGVFKIKGFVEELIVHDHTPGLKTPLEASANLLGIVSKSGEWQGGTWVFFQESVDPGRSSGAGIATIES